VDKRFYTSNVPSSLDINAALTAGRDWIHYFKKWIKL